MSDAFDCVYQSVMELRGMTYDALMAGGITVWEHDELVRLNHFLGELCARIRGREGEE